MARHRAAPAGFSATAWRMSSPRLKTPTWVGGSDCDGLRPSPTRPANSADLPRRGLAEQTEHVIVSRGVGVGPFFGQLDLKGRALWTQLTSDDALQLLVEQVGDSRPTNDEIRAVPLEGRHGRRSSLLPTAAGP